MTRLITICTLAIIFLSSCGPIPTFPKHSGDTCLGSNYHGLTNCFGTYHDIYGNKYAGVDIKGQLELKDLRKVKRNYSLTFKQFLFEFIFTNSIDDYNRSLVRISERYELHIPKIEVMELKMELINREKISKIVSHLVSEAQKKADFLSNEFYVTLERLAGISDDFSVGGYIEIELVKEIRKISGKIVPLTIRNEGRFLYLLNHARYEVFSRTLYVSQNWG